MSAGQRANDVEHRLRELTAAQDRRTELVQAYRVMDRSKFARVRSLWFLLKDLAGAASRRDRLYALSREGAFVLPRSFSTGGGCVPAAPLAARAESEFHQTPYDVFRGLNEVRDGDIPGLRRMVDALAWRPTFSILIPVYDTPEPYLRAMLDSLLAQIYPWFEVCVADDNSPSTHIRHVIEEYRARDARIKVVYRSENGHISRATNSALDIAHGDYVALVDHDDLLTRDALLRMAVEIAADPDVDMVYSDEDKIDEDGVRSDPFFKPEWSPETILTRMYVGHLGVYRTAIAKEIGGFRPECDGSQDWDFVLRFTERTQRIHHVARVLYSWRIHRDSAASGTDAKPYAYVAARRAVAEAMERRGEPSELTNVDVLPHFFHVRRKLPDPPRVTIVVPTRDRVELLRPCLRSVFEKSTYPNFEVLVVDNGSVDPATLAYFDEQQQKRRGRFRVIRVDEPFNFSRLVNRGVEASASPLVVLLNNDTEVIAADWLEALVEQAARPQIGAAGALLLYPDETVQHSGVIMGLGGLAGHAHHGLPSTHGGYFAALQLMTNFTAVTAACLAVRRDVYQEVGGFDEHLKVAFNDVDFCCKLVQAGYRNVYVPAARLYHHESKSRGLNVTAEQREREAGEVRYVAARWGPLIDDDPRYSPHLSRRYSDFRLRVGD